MLSLWLPLNGNTTQQGVSSSTVSNVTATVDNSGKIGKCYSFSGSQHVAIPEVIIPSNTTAWSFACWFYLANTTSSSAACLFSERTGANAAGYTIFIYPSFGQMLVDDGARWQVTPMTFTAQTWYHLVVTRDSTGKKIYINGELKSSTTTIGTTTSINPNGCLIGKAQNSTDLTNGDQGFIGKLNDVRVYVDHALSPKEIEILSRGLVCHYPLEGANNTLLPFGYQQLEYIESTGASAFDTKYKFNPETDSLKMIFKGNDVSNNGMLFGQSAGQYFWLYYYGSNGIRVYANNGSSQEGISGIPSDLVKHTAEFKNKHYIIDGVDKGSLSNTYTEATYPSWMFSYGSTTYCFKGRIYYAQIGRNGKVQRTFIPAKRLSDSKIGMYELNTDEFFPSGTSTAFTAGNVVGTPSTVYDTSGFKYNGTMNGSATSSTDTPRYSASTEFSKAGHIVNSSFGLTTNAFTVNFWVKLKTASSQHFVLGTFDNWTGNGFGLYREANGTTYQSLIRSTAESTYKQHTMALTGSVWQMLTYVYTGTHYKGYLNGVLKFDDTYGLNGNVSHPALVIANSYFSGTPASENEEAFLSDFRFYATALSDTQIAELYNTAVSVSNNGALLGYELVEV